MGGRVLISSAGQGRAGELLSLLSLSLICRKLFNEMKRKAGPLAGNGRGRGRTTYCKINPRRHRDGLKPQVIGTVQWHIAYKRTDHRFFLISLNYFEMIVGVFITMRCHYFDLFYLADRVSSFDQNIEFKTERQ